MAIVCVRLCDNCGNDARPSRRGRCKNCAAFFDRHGVERPAVWYDRSTLTCSNCGKVGAREGAGRCKQCLRYFQKHREERPQEVAERMLLRSRGLKRCAVCSEVKAIAEFPSGSSATYTRKYCSACDEAGRGGWPYRKTEKFRRSKAASAMWRRGKKAAEDAEKFEAIEIFERDRWRCQICGRKVDKKLSGRALMGPQLDHIVPLSKGGTHTRSNTQLAHLSCNVRKGARAVGDQLRLFG